MSEPTATPPAAPEAPATPAPDTPANPNAAATPHAIPEGSPAPDAPKDTPNKPQLPKDGPGSLVTGQPAKAEDVPEKPDGYQFSFQSDTIVDEGLLTEFRAYAHKKGLSQAQAGELAQFYEYAARKSVADAQTALIQQEQGWKEQCQVDPEIGGPRFEESIALATRAVEEFSTPELLHVLHTTGYGSHPAIVKFFVNVGRKLADKPMPKGEAPAADKTLAELMYPSMTNNA